MRIPTLKMYAMKEIHTHFIKDDMSNFERKSELINYGMYTQELYGLYPDKTFPGRVWTVSRLNFSRQYIDCLQTKYFQAIYELYPD